MKTLILLLLLCSFALADFPGQNPRPAVTQTELPEYIKDAIRERLNDPDSMEVVSWTLPELRTRNYKGQYRASWSMHVVIRTKNIYGALERCEFGVSIKGGEVFYCAFVQ